MNDMPCSLFLEDLTFEEVEAVVSGGYRTIVVGVGSVEQHGPHLPLKTDALWATVIPEMVARRLGSALVAPPIRPGVSSHHMAFPGTITIRESTLRALIEDYVESLVRHGFTRIVFLATHGGNFATVRHTVEDLVSNHNADRAGVRLIPIADIDALMAAFARVAEEDGITPGEAGFHAGETETSQMLAVAPREVRRERLIRGYTGGESADGVARAIQDGLKSISDIGVAGDPRQASAARGARYNAAWVKMALDAIDPPGERTQRNG